jgi:surface carbohydrate biosynthesis protein (TIGR04326 family)
MSAVLCVIADAVGERALDLLGSGRATVDLLAFADAVPTLPACRRILGARIRQELDTRALLQVAVPRARERFVRFAAEWPDRAFAFGRRFREAFASGGCSSFWFTELSQKNAGTRPTFGRLCQLEALRLALAAGDYTGAIVISRDRDTADVLARSCLAHSVHATTADEGARGGDGFTRLFLGRLKRLWLDACVTIAACVARLPAGEPTRPGERRIAFHTWFPTQWTMWRGQFRDRYFVDLPDAIASKTLWRPLYACLLPAESWRQIRTGINAARRQTASEPGRYVFVERFARLRDVCRVYLDLRAALKYWWLERFDAQFRRSFDWDGVDVFPWLRHDLRVTLIRDLPFLELLAQRIAGLVRHVNPTDLVTILETYGYGRAVAWGVHSSGAPTRLVGYQHSVVNANQLVYRFSLSETGDGRAPFIDHVPLPDEFLVHGEHARGMLQRSGIPDRRIAVCGGPRFDDLVEFRLKRREAFAELRREVGVRGSERLILIATVIWPSLTTRLIEACGDALRDFSDALVVIKPHPLHRRIDAEVAAAIPSTASRRVVIAHDALNRLQAAADVMIGTYATSDIEAIAIGCPVIRFQSTDFDLSPSSDEPGATLDAWSADEMRLALRRVLIEGYQPPAAADLIERVFYNLDGRSVDRVIAAMDRFDPLPAAVPPEALTLSR